MFFPPPQPPPSPSGHDTLTQIMLTIFRVNATLLEHGNRMVTPLGLTSARWQVMGALALSGQPLTCPQISAFIGISRQGAQKQLHLAHQDGLVFTLPNPEHERSPFYQLTEHGRSGYDKAMRLQDMWSHALSQSLPATELETTLQTLQTLEHRLKVTPLPTAARTT